MKVLVVEDNPADARLIGEMLKDSRAGSFHLQQAPRLDAALERLRREIFDVVLLDLALPDSQGIQTLTHVRHAGGGSPIVVLTGLDDERVGLEAVRAGAQDYLVKGNFSGELLVRTIRYAIERKRIEEEVRRLNAQLELRVAERTAQLQVTNQELTSEIAERKRAEAALIEAKEVAETRMAQLRTTLDNLAEAVYVCDPEGKPLLANPAFQRLIRLELDTLPQSGEAIAALFPLFELDGRAVELADTPSCSALRGEIVSGRVLRLGRQPERERILRYNAAPVRDRNGSVIMAVLSIEDITAAKMAEAALIRSEKLASVGRMAASIAHEINNPLAAVMNSIFIARDNLTSPEQVGTALEVADEELRRIAHLTRQALGFYRESQASTDLSINEVLDSAVDLLKSKIKAKRATVRKHYEAEVEMLGVAGELRQVFSNIIANSLDAIAEGGSINLCIVPSGKGTQNESVTVMLADDGEGISADALPHVFEPFFTTKQETGTGLGMWIAKQLVEKHSGSIRLESATDGPTRGTSARVVLPLNRESATRRAERQPVQVKAAVG